MTTAFDSWHAKEVGNGLADLKFAIVAGKGVSADAIQHEILTAELAIEKGYTTPAPKATSVVPEQIRVFVSEH